MYLPGGAHEVIPNDQLARPRQITDQINANTRVFEKMRDRVDRTMMLMRNENVDTWGGFATTLTGIMGNIGGNIEGTWGKAAYDIDRHNKKMTQSTGREMGGFKNKLLNLWNKATDWIVDKWNKVKEYLMGDSEEVAAW